MKEEKTQKLYLKGWEYNSYLIINALAKIIKENDGEFLNSYPYIKPYYSKIQIVNRSIIEEIENCKRFLTGKTSEEIKNNEILLEKLNTFDKLSKINNKAKTVQFKNYITFKLENCIYYIQLQDNPFFEDYIQKENISEIKNNEYIVKYNHYMENLKKDWIEEYPGIKTFYDSLNAKQIKDLATRLFQQLKKHPVSEIITDKKRVNNYYDNNYHYEYIKEIRNKKYIKSEV